jgi:pyruvate formate lyase activating enzyme
MPFRVQDHDSYTNAPAVHGVTVGAPPDPRRPRNPALQGRGVALALLATPVEDPLAPLSGHTAAQTIRCDVCAHRCVIREGRSGICQVRENRNGTLVSLVYGEAVAVHVEPIEKKPFFHVLPGTDALSISTVGCNFHCRYCQNWEISQAPREGFHLPTRTLPPEQVVREALAAGARSIAYTYVEPAVFLEYALDTARLAHDAGLVNLFVTNGYETPEALELLAPVLDAANVDLKAFDDRFYRRICGARLEPVKETLIAMRRLGIWVEVTTLVVPGENDDPAELGAAADWIARELGPETPWHLSRFYPAYRMADWSVTPVATLREAARIGRQAGLRHVYVGNVPGEDDTDTRCTGCGRVLIRRDGYRVARVALRGNACPDCGTPLAGLGLDVEP